MVEWVLAYLKTAEVQGWGLVLVAYAVLGVLSYGVMRAARWARRRMFPGPSDLAQAVLEALKGPCSLADNPVGVRLGATGVVVSTDDGAVLCPVGDRGVDGWWMHRLIPRRDLRTIRVAARVVREKLLEAKRARVARDIRKQLGEDTNGKATASGGHDVVVIDGLGIRRTARVDADNRVHFTEGEIPF